MNIITNEHSLLNAMFRSVPLTVPILLFIIYMYTYNPVLLHLIIGQFVIQLSVPIFKNYLAYPIGIYLTNICKTEDIPIIGRFKRPIGAKNTGCFYVSDDNYSFTQGMPSGHSMIMAFVSVFLYYYLVDLYKFNNTYKNYLFLICMLFILYMMYTRVLMNAHTLQQTIIGSIIGSILAYYYYIYIKNKFINKKKSTNNI